MEIFLNLSKNFTNEKILQYMSYVSYVETVGMSILKREGWQFLKGRGGNF